jgi:chromosome partitioning protein
MPDARLLKSELGAILGTEPHAVSMFMKNHGIPSEMAGRRKVVAPSGARAYLEARGFRYPRHLTVALQIVKGGCGKTTISFGLALRASHYGCRVLAVDLDQQGNFSRALGAMDVARDKPIWVDVNRKTAALKDTIVPISEFLDLVPSDLRNSQLEGELSSSHRSVHLAISQHLEEIQDHYDLIVIDCPPNVSCTTMAAACAADQVIIPLYPDAFAIDGLSYTLKQLKDARTDYGKDIPFAILWNKYDARERICHALIHEVAANPEYARHVMHLHIRTDSAARNAITLGQDVFSQKKSHHREDIDDFAREVIGLNAWALEVTEGMRRIA